MKINNTFTPFGILIQWLFLIPFVLLATISNAVIILVFLVLLLAWYGLFTYTAKLGLLSIKCEKELNPKVALGILIGYIFSTLAMLLLSSDLDNVMFYFVLIPTIAIDLIYVFAVDINHTITGEPI